MSNAFLNREDQTQGRQEDLYQLLLQVMREEYPDDPRYQNGNTYVSDPTSPVRDNNNQELLNANELIKSSRNSQKVVKLNASQITHTEYALDKKLPSIGIDDLDDLLDDEWQFYLDIPGLEKPRVDGLFLINLEINLNPPDFHHAYITRGPARIQERVDAGENLDDVIKSTFCVYFISNSAALPIPNYKTLEVMLVERGKTYNDIQEASIEQTKEFDLEIDGRFLADTDGTYDPFEEFKFRQMLDRSFSWNERVRFDSGYLPGYDDNTVQFERDPGDYLKPSSQQEDGLYFDIVYQKQTYREKLREKYEGKLIALQWALPYDSGSMTLQERANILTAENTLVNDDKVFYVRMMINGYWKQVVSLNVLRQYCILNNLSLADFRLDRQEYGPDGNQLPKTTLVDPVFNQSGADAATYIYNGLYGVNGIMNLIAEQQGMEIINDYNITGQEVSQAYELLLALFTNLAGGSIDPDELSRSITAYLNEIKAPGWSDFGHIAEVNRLDTTEYEEYLNNHNNGGNPFEIDYLQPYEPPGSVKYYPSSQLV